ncbi:nucleotide sugar dehydrogenase [Thermomonas sp.]|uniref:nucleotide sugar dehydrogenase n=1 Tax=Thermomonas sp. TaxID=1971895 RepID=UPI002486FC2E|nr:nucleotide sugar dehydrogenase [Thermomonas sp.]MDI1253527.1 nucleotide sugar dehydrogenase [Thermomonas sp.]
MDFAEKLARARIAIVGLGYVGLPLAVEFGKHYDTIGFDINAERIRQLQAGIDTTLEVDAEELASITRLEFTSALSDIAGCNTYIVTVPTPIDDAKRPDLGPLVKASEALGIVLKPGDTVIYESTVYPGCTEEVCMPILERFSKLRYDGRAFVPLSPEEVALRKAERQEELDELGDAASLEPAAYDLLLDPEGADADADAGQHRKMFSIGYSPERINPGDKQHRLTSILKVTSGSTPEAADFIDALYASIITAGTHKASSIKVAEAAKVIENTQRDLNIALINDLAVLFRKLDIDTLDVLEAAGTKWNFLPFRPGLVGGHCISVDPYYLTHKATQVGHHSQVILAGRRTNDGMGAYVADQVIKLMLRKGINPVQARVLILGLAFKENCPDLRNTRVVDIIDTLRSYNAQVDVHDPWVDVAEAQHEYGIIPVGDVEQGAYDAVIVAVGHEQFRQLGGDGVRAFGKASGSVVYDVKYVLPRDAVDGRL